MKFEDIAKMLDEDPDEAARQAALKLDEDPDDALSLFVIAEVYMRAERWGFASNLYRRITQIKPDRAEVWNNLGLCLDGMGRHKEAREAFKEASNRRPDHMALANIGMTYFKEMNFSESEKWCRKALAIEPESKAARNTLGMVLLSTGKWAEGFQNYAASVGGKFRKQNQYKDEPMWSGRPGQSVVFYGEQGLGDEIMFASCIPDAQKVCKTTILECDKRLTGLFTRSFPGVHVYGTRRQTECTWLQHEAIDASLPVGQLPQYFRPEPAACPGTPYLKADPERRTQWRALFDSWGPRPKIGLAWSGGSKHNNPKERAAGLEAFRFLIESVDADFVSLQYKDPLAEIKESGLNVRHYRRACETDDYDDTAAMVAELDLVVSVPTTVVHLAGALGVQTHCLTPARTEWMMACGLPFYSSVRLINKPQGESWNECIRRYAASFHRLRPEAAAGLQRPTALDSFSGVRPGSNHALNPVAAAYQAARAY